MNTFGDTKSKINPRNILEGILGSYEDFERETSIISTIASTFKDLAGGVYEATADLSQTAAITEAKTEANGIEKFSKGTIEFNQAVKKEVAGQQKKKEETDRVKAFFQALKEDQKRTQRAKDRLLFEEEINDIATNLPTEQKNQLLHYQAAYRDRSIYQRAELRKKLIEQRKQEEKKQKQASIPSPAKQPSAMEGAFEGRSGGQGSGTANLSAQAVG